MAQDEPEGASLVGSREPSEILVSTNYTKISVVFASGTGTYSAGDVVAEDGNGRYDFYDQQSGTINGDDLGIYVGHDDIDTSDGHVNGPLLVEGTVKSGTLTIASGSQSFGSGAFADLKDRGIRFV